MGRRPRSPAVGDLHGPSRDRGARPKRRGCCRVTSSLLLTLLRAIARRASAEAVGTAFLVAIVVGSGIYAQRLSPSQPGLQLLENAIATGAGLVALILAIGPISGGHFNPAVTLADRLLGGISYGRGRHLHRRRRWSAQWWARSPRT